MHTKVMSVTGALLTDQLAGGRQRRPLIGTAAMTPMCRACESCGRWQALADCQPIVSLRMRHGVQHTLRGSAPMTCWGMAQAIPAVFVSVFLELA